MPARTQCSNPSPSLTPAWFLKQILCYLRSVFGDGTTPGTGVITVAEQPLPFGADEVSITYDGTFVDVATYKKDGVTVGTATCSNDGTNITGVVYT